MPPPTPRHAPDASARPLVGVDFSSSPGPRKPIVVAHGRRVGPVLRLDRLERLPSLTAFADWLAQPAGPEGPWLGGFDLPFGLPRELVQALAWPTDWRACIAHYAGLDRATIRDTFAAFCDARPVGAKFAHRACDGPAGSSPSMKWVNPPVAFMLHAGLPPLLAAGAWLPAHEPPPADVADRPIALEAYPGWLARAVLGRRSYKADDRARQTPERLIARLDLLDALEQGRTPHGLRLKLGIAPREALAADASGDALDAVLCLLQAGWAAGQPGFGLPPGVDPLEGWIAGV